MSVKGVMNDYYNLRFDNFNLLHVHCLNIEHPILSTIGHVFISILDIKSPYRLHLQRMNLSVLMLDLQCLL